MLSLWLLGLSLRVVYIYRKKGIEILQRRMWQGIMGKTDSGVKETWVQTLTASWPVV